MCVCVCVCVCVCLLTILIFVVNLKNVFIHFWLPWVFGSWLLRVGFPELGRVEAPPCGVWFPVAASRIVERGLKSCGARADLLHGMWNLPGPGIKPVTPALAGVVWQLSMTNFPPFSLNLLG